MKFYDLTGQVFDRLTVLSRVENAKNGDARWLCQCTCGKQAIVRGTGLRNGATKSCGCFRREYARLRATVFRSEGLGKPLIDLTGQVFGRWAVTDRCATNGPKGQPRWNVVCACGTKRVVRGALLRTGRSKSCGCRQ